MTLEDFLNQKKKKNKEKRDKNLVDPRKLLEKLDDDREKIRREQETSYEKDGWNASAYNEDEDDINFIVPVAEDKPADNFEEKKSTEDCTKNQSDNKFVWLAGNQPSAIPEVVEISEPETKSYVPAPLRSGASYTPAGAKPNVGSAMDFPSLGVVGNSEPVKPKPEIDVNESSWVQVGGSHKNDYNDFASNGFDRNSRNRGFMDKSENRGWQESKSDAPMSWRKGVNVTGKTQTFHQPMSFNNRSTDVWVRRGELSGSGGAQPDRPANQNFVIHQSNRFSALEEKN